MQAASPISPARSSSFLLAIIFLTAAVLRVIFLGARSFWADEIISVRLAIDTWGGFWFWLSTREGNMALYYLLLREWIKLGDSEAWVRLFSALAGIATIPMLYVLAKRLYDERIACLITLLAATNACLVEFSQEARSYSLLILLVVLSYYFFVRLVQEGRPLMALPYTLVSIAAMYAHFFAALAICAQAVSILWLPAKKVPWSRLVPAWLMIGLGAVPISFYVFKRDVGQLYWVQHTTIAEVYKLAIFYAGGSKGAAAVLSVISLAIIFVACSANRKSPRARTDASWRFMLALLWALLPVLLTILVSLQKPIFVHRYLLVALPGYLILIGLGLGQIRRLAMLSASLASILGLSAISIVQGYSRPVEDWRGAVDYVLSRSQPQDSILIYVAYATDNFVFYEARRERSGLRKNVARIGPLQSAAQLEALDSPRTWLLIYPWPHFAQDAPAFESSLHSRYANLDRKQFRGIEVLLYAQLKQPPSLLREESASRR